MRKIRLFYFIFITLLLLTSCTSSLKNDKAPNNSDGESSYAPKDDYYGGIFDSESSDSIKPGAPGESPEMPDYDIAEPIVPDGDEDYPVDKPQTQGPAAGQITASAWSDHKNYDFWNNLFKSDQENNPGLFNDYFTKLNIYNTTINTQKMITVKITDNNTPAVNLPVSIKNSNYQFNALTNVSGIAYLFLPNDSSFPYTIEYNDNSYELKEYTTNTIELSTTLPATEIAINYLDLMFVIDTTGSMGDELSYLKSEIKDVIERIDTNKNNIRLSLLFYRDEGDQYVTRFFDFTTDINSQLNNINNQKANGGGDFEEAVDVALNLATTQASWSEHSNKILIHVLDAPPHSTKQNINLFANSILTAAEKGIRIIPVASSGIDKWTEFLLRTEALITGGTYTYITNHSGIGGDHIDATVGSVVVEYLNDMLVRLINEYYTGIETKPIPYNQKQ